MENGTFDSSLIKRYESQNVIGHQIEGDGRIVQEILECRCQMQDSSIQTVYRLHNLDEGIVLGFPEFYRERPYFNTPVK